MRVSITFSARICFECIGVYKLLPTSDRFQNETGRNQKSAKTGNHQKGERAEIEKKI